MSKSILPAHILHCVPTILCFLIAVPASYSDVDERYALCSRQFNCGKRHLISRFYLNCYGNPSRSPTIDMENESFQVLGIDGGRQTMTITPAGLNLLGGYCPSVEWPETIINHTLFSYSETVRNLSIFFNCSGGFTSVGKNNFSCPSEDGVINGFYTIDDARGSLLENRSSSCRNVIKVPVQLTAFNFDYLIAGKLREVLIEGFQVRYRADNESCAACSSSQGICGSNETSDEFACLCRDKPHMPTCPTGVNLGKPSMTQNISLIVGIIGITTACITICIFTSKKFSLTLSAAVRRKITKSDKDLEAFIRNYGPLPLKRYNFSDVKKLTNSFKDKLGQGGFGGVYKGRLLDGYFVNEVASISRTSHVNVVTLLGFCLEGNNRALIYEFMPNGSLEKFVYNGDTSKPCQYLRWEKMYEIVIGIAKGLEYLHHGCSTKILHFDIKPHNILLDEDFCPKISDFGLAKLCTTKEGIVSSLLGARGIIGYIAPEVFSRNFGEVSHKSDVYSFGMMIMELVGCKNNLDSGVDSSSEVYFPHWIYRHVEQDREFKLPGVVTRKENEIAKKMIIVGLWCIQARPSDRPPMNEVIEMLQGSTEALQIPPTPFLSSPPRAPIDSFTFSTLRHNDRCKLKLFYVASIFVSETDDACNLN
ncbi:LEAF RUST 10 DISEASE-RESISTANCE LOCUS RECEPTOR-LIKE PROTEIN KINASE-like 2.1 [Citrus sinensis]|uniref:LEAF RUST 10 DISEASE-RESISTANCE LOCUS RECEPTOR-LIKE PROTEIN KINASE-like 2.1 n=1 Tax=Citrus sinensis TaxID=2711 RepID=A0ACB8M0K9_CITSI|nr:LEAF RUST 10 DISEASE-RESISTANCE LOCUS RECEPTOR-LIKE PROTEIN KINASE-like 2.1 [Citrus sinensis]